MVKSRPPEKAEVGGQSHCSSDMCARQQLRQRLELRHVLRARLVLYLRLKNIVQEMPSLSAGGYGLGRLLHVLVVVARADAFDEDLVSMRHMRLATNSVLLRQWFSRLNVSRSRSAKPRRGSAP